MAVNDLYEVKVWQDFGTRSEELLNVYFFKQTSGTGNSSTLTDAFMNTLDPLVRAIQTWNVATRRVESRNLFDVADFHARTFEPATLNGDYHDDTLPVHDAVTFRLVRTSREIRNGFKRYGGISEAVVQNGLITDAGYIDKLNDLASALSGGIEAGTLGADEFDHVVVKRIRSGAGTTGDPYRYRLPIDGSEAVSSSPSNVLVNLFIRHQDSRGN